MFSLIYYDFVLRHNILYFEGFGKPPPRFSQWLALHARTCRDLHVAGCGADCCAACGGECFRHSEGNRQMGRNADRSGADSDRIVYALRTSAQPAEFRVLGARRADGAGWRMGCAVARHSFFSGVLPDERRFLFRNAYSDVGRRNGRLSPACRIRCRYGASCGHRRMAVGVQRCRVGRILQPDAGDSKVALADCRLAFYSRGHLLWSNLFLLKR